MSLFSSDKLAELQLQQQAFKHRVLLIDDELDNLNAMGALLGSICKVITASSALEAMEIIKGYQAQEISAIISDQRMPDMTGTEFLQQTLETHPDTLRIIVSGYSDLEAILKAINKAKIYHFVTKPIESQEFLYVVQQALNTYEFKTEVLNELERLKTQLFECKKLRQVKEKQLTAALAQLEQKKL